MKPINLAKCEIGQRVKLRNGRLIRITSIKKDTTSQGRVVQINDDAWRWNNGNSYSNRTDPIDIIAILPLPKKKAPPRLQKALALPAPLDKRAIKAAIKTLQALLK